MFNAYEGKELTPTQCEKNNSKIKELEENIENLNARLMIVENRGLQFNKQYIPVEALKPLLKRWYNLLCESGTNTKAQVRKEIKTFLTTTEAPNENNTN